MNLRSKNETLKNDLDTIKQINERMMKSQADMNQLYEKIHQRQKGIEGLGYIEESESSKKAA